MDLKKWGPYIFLIGFVIAILIGIAGQSLNEDTHNTLLGVLVILGLLVGLVNVSEEEAIPFLIATIALLQVNSAISVLQNLTVFYPGIADLLPIVTAFVSKVVVFVLPAALVVALKAIYDQAGEGAFEKVGKVVGPTAVKRR